MCTLSVVAGSNNNITEFETHAHASNAGSTAQTHWSRARRHPERRRRLALATSANEQRLCGATEPAIVLGRCDYV